MGPSLTSETEGVSGPAVTPPLRFYLPLRPLCLGAGPGQRGRPRVLLLVARVPFAGPHPLIPAGAPCSSKSHPSPELKSSSQHFLGVFTWSQVP